MNNLVFKNIELNDRFDVEPFLIKVANRSCQFTFVSLFCLRDKYGTQICIDNNTLYIRQINRTIDDKIAYFLPIIEGEDSLDNALHRIINTAKVDGHLIYLFNIIDDNIKELLKSKDFEFHFQEKEDWSEYLYYTHRLRDLKKSDLHRQKRTVKKFWKTYENDDVMIEDISLNNILEIKEFQKKWYEAKLLSLPNDESISHENKAIQIAFDNFKELELFGIALRINGIIEGYSYGVVISDNTFDKIVEKGNYNINNVYRVISQEMAKKCDESLIWTNMEEDLGIEGLRTMKQRYKPDCLIIKYDGFIK